MAQVYAQYTINNIGDLLDVIQQKEADNRKNRTRMGYRTFWYRGHGDISWTLAPGVQRCKGYNLSMEKELNNSFRMRASQILDNPPDKNDYSAWMSLMQHYGLATRLLDWSRSPLIAAYFATEGTDDTKDACIWVLRPGLLNKMEIDTDVIYPIDSTTVEEMLRHAFKGTVSGDEPALREGERAYRRREALREREELGNRHIVACQSVTNDLRMYSQQACFTVHDTGASLEEKQNNDLLSQLIIPAESKKEFRNELRILGIHESFIYPDMDHISRDIKRKYGLL